MAIAAEGRAGVMDGAGAGWSDVSDSKVGPAYHTVMIESASQLGLRGKAKQNLPRTGRSNSGILQV